MQQATSSPRSPGQQRTRGGSPWEVEADISVLLSKHSVEEVRKIEQETRLDIERKKEELRQMVGERYRDLIDAADSIMELQTGSKQVGESLDHMIRVCQSLQQTHFLRGLGGMRGPPVRDETREVTAQMKVLGDAPEKIWKCLERQQYLEATWAFLEARHTHTQLQVTLAKNALLSRLWTVASGFRSTILECCRRRLETTDQTRSAVVSSLSAIVLLEGSSLRQTFSRFLLAQKVAIQAVFHPSKQMHYSVKVQLSEAVTVIRRSIILISSIFCLRPTQSSSLLLQTVKEFNSNLQKASISAVLKSTVSEVPADHLQTSCLEWLAACVEDVKEGAKPLLSHITSVKALSNIKAALHSILSQPDTDEATPPEKGRGSGASWSDEWAELSRLVFARDSICIWGHFLRDLFFERAKTILTKHFNSTETQAADKICKILDDLTSDPARYAHDINVTTQLWAEEGAGLVPGGRGGGKWTNLSLRAKACTPSVYRFCQEVGGMLEVIVEDSSHYLLPLDTGSLPTQREEVFPFRLHGDHDDMRQFLRNSTVDFVKGFLERVQKTVTSLSADLEDQLHTPSTTSAADRLLVVGRVCQALSEFCPPLSLLSHGCRPPPSSLATSRQKVRSQRMAKQKEDSETDTVSQLLFSQGFSIHKIWADSTAQQFVAKYREQLLSSSEINSLSCCLVWEEITIVEEAESGKQVSSVIRVPSQASVYVTSLLFAACQEISRVGGHTMERTVLQLFTGKCLSGVLEVHRSFLAQLGTSVPIHQNCALQLLVNVRFLCRVLSSPPHMEEDTTEVQRIVVEQLHSYIDPFDLSVFAPHLLSALERQLQRSTVLLGFLLAVKGSSHHLLSGQKLPGSSSQEKHIVLPLFPSIPRFPSLPTVTPHTHTLAPTAQHLNSEEDVKSPKSFMETVAFFHHM